MALALQLELLQVQDLSTSPLCRASGKVKDQTGGNTIQCIAESRRNSVMPVTGHLTPLP